MIKFLRYFAFRVPRRFRVFLYELFPKLGGLVLGRSISKRLSIHEEPPLIHSTKLLDGIHYLDLKTFKSSRIAFISPSLPLQSGIAWNSTHLWQHLNQFIPVDFFQSPTSPTRHHLHPQFLHLAALPLVTKKHRYSLCLVAIGNGWHFDDIVSMISYLKDLPTVVLLHDVRISGIRPTANLSQQELGELGLGVLPANVIGLIVHSRHAKSLVSNHLINTPIKVMETGVPILRVMPNQSQLLNNMIVGTAGFFDNMKRPIVVIDSFIVLGKSDKSLQFQWLGDISNRDRQALNERWEKNGLDTNRLNFLGYRSEDEFRSILSQWRVGINIRSRSNGESSGVVAELAATGTPCVVSNIGSFSELPSDLFTKVHVNCSAYDVANAASNILYMGDQEFLNLSQSLNEWAISHTFPNYAREILQHLEEFELEVKE